MSDPKDAPPSIPQDAAPAPTPPTTTTTKPQPKNPLHGVTLEQVLTALVAFFGWDELGQRINIRCFTADPSISSSLKFLRKTPWAREKTEGLYLFMLREKARRARRAAAEARRAAGAVGVVEGAVDDDDLAEEANDEAEFGASPPATGAEEPID